MEAKSKMVVAGLSLMLSIGASACVIHDPGYGYYHRGGSYYGPHTYYRSSSYRHDRSWRDHDNDDHWQGRNRHDNDRTRWEERRTYDRD